MYFIFNKTMPKNLTHFDNFDNFDRNALDFLVSFWQK